MDHDYTRATDLQAGRRSMPLKDLTNTSEVINLDDSQSQDESMATEFLSLYKAANAAAVQPIKVITLNDSLTEKDVLKAQTTRDEVRASTSTSSHGVQQHAQKQVFNCSKCNKIFSISEHKDAHERVCSGVMNTCKHCPFKTSSLITLAAHIKTQHPEKSPENQHACPDCKRKYKTARGLKRHMKTMCGKKKLYYCEHCEYGANTKVFVTNHMKREHPEMLPPTNADESSNGSSEGTTSNNSIVSGKSKISVLSDAQIKFFIQEAVRKLFDDELDYE